MKITIYLFILISTISPAYAFEFDISKFKGIVVPAITIDSLPYKDVETQFAPSIVVMGRLGNAFIEGNRFGYMVNRSELGALSLVGQIRSHQYIPVTENLTERKKAFEIGVQLARPITENWRAQFNVFTDISDTHSGTEFEAGLYRRFSWDKLRLLTYVAIQHQNKKLTGYYTDTADYSATSTLSGEVEFIASYELKPQLEIVAISRIYAHDSDFQASPLIDSGTTQRWLIGLGWRF
jgi:hypothetical protein